MPATYESLAPNGHSTMVTRIFQKIKSWVEGQGYSTTDEKVKQTVTDNTNSEYELLFSGTADNTTHTEETRKSLYAKFNPNKQATTFGTRYSNSTIGSYSFVSGYINEASGTYSHAEGNTTHATGTGAHAEGYNTRATYEYAHAEGSNAVASNTAAHAEGGGTLSNGMYSHSEGYSTSTSGYFTHAEGLGSTASNSASHAEGSYTKASSDYQHVQGKYNIEDTQGTYAHIIGNGTSNNARSNAQTIDWDGNEVLAGMLTDKHGVQSLRHLTAEQYNALTETEKMNGVTYHIIDSDVHNAQCYYDSTNERIIFNYGASYDSTNERITLS